jgi:hypothetical protein
MSLTILKNILKEIDKIITKKKSNVVSNLFIKNIEKIEGKERLKETFIIIQEKRQQTHFQWNILNEKKLKNFLKTENIHLYHDTENIKFIFNYIDNIFVNISERGVKDKQVSKLFYEEYLRFENLEELNKYFVIETIDKFEIANLFEIKNEYVDFLKLCIIKNKILTKKEYKDLFNSKLYDEILKDKSIVNEEVKTKETKFKSEIQKDIDKLLLNENINNNNNLLLNQNKEDFFSSRSELALHNKTHEVKTNISILQLIQNDTIYCVLFPQPKTINCIKPKNNKIALIIENLENFVHYKEYIDKFNIVLNKEELDIIFSSGNSISSDKNKDFLNDYQIIYTFFDLDKAGFDIYINLKRNLTTNVENIYVKNIENYFQKIITNNYKFKDGIFEYLKLNIQYLTKRDIEILLMIEKYGTMEQEIFLD